MYNIIYIYNNKCSFAVKGLKFNKEKLNQSTHNGFPDLDKFLWEDTFWAEERFVIRMRKVELEELFNEYIAKEIVNDPLCQGIVRHYTAQPLAKQGPCFLLFPTGHLSLRPALRKALH